MTSADAHARRFALAFGLFVLACAGDSFAWGARGHRVIAAMAEARLDGPVESELKRLLAVTGARELADVAAWADELREETPQSPLAKATTKLHYVNFSDAGCRYDAARVCPGGQCVVAAIDRYAAILGERSRPDAERAEALRFLVHFVGDAHQPLHAGYRSDRGGNEFQVRLGGKGSNLHSVWDFDVLSIRRIGWRRYAAALQPPRREAAHGRPRDWAEASCRLTRDGGVYPSSRKLDARYLAAMQPIAEQRLQRAAIELAAMIQRALAR